MRKLVAVTLVIALVSFIFAPLPAFAGGRHGSRGHRSNAGISTGAAVGIGVGAFVLGVLVGHGQPTVGQHPIVLQDVVILPQPVVLRPRVIWPANCAPQYGYIYNDPYNPGIPRYVPTGLMECRWPNGQTTLYYQDGRMVSR